MERTKEKLIGCQLISVDDEHIVLKSKDGELVTLFIVEDEGDCCGYTEVTTRLLVDELDVKDNPIITSVECIDKDCDSHATCKITLFGLNKPMAEIEATAGSGSGWMYGACVKLLCKKMDIKCDIVCW